ncbi:uncharacterized protein LOC103968063 isoform X2 [Pyrus x bretschneideri]|uniref:uncharacterized protein LOC103968063 isoform X2 n=1 Tax=Pyrus x bretschneideri TaxID=225117 RepID=UPI00202FEFB7|nr:uncharacterized protein LOC103968063 isoform X2 [Pyrus x bretschneideri]
MKFGLRCEFTWKCMYAVCIIGRCLSNSKYRIDFVPIYSTQMLSTNTRFLPHSHDDCCVLPRPEKVRIQPSQTWPALSAVEYQQVHLKFLIKFGIEPWSFEQHLGQAVFIPAGCPFQEKEIQHYSYHSHMCASQALFYTNFNAPDTHFRIIGIDQIRKGKSN